MASPKQKIILVAEDDPDDRALITEAFAEAKIVNPVVFVEDGVQLLEFLQGKPQGDLQSTSLGIVLLDLNMPRMDGREALRRIRSSTKLRRVPVVVLTTSGAAEDISQSYEDGANSFITKPLTFGGLVEVAETLGKYWLDTVELPERVAG